MKGKIWEKIEEVRAMPEEARMRYVIGCLVVSMSFILGIWVLSVKETFQGVARDVPKATEMGKNLLAPKNEDSLEAAGRTEPLNIHKEPTKTGNDYFQEQFLNTERKVPAEFPPAGE